MSKRIKTAALLLTGAMLLAVLSGCVLAETGFSFNADGSVSVTDGFYYSEDYFKSIDQTPQEFFASLEQPVYDVSTAYADGKTYYGFCRDTAFGSVAELLKYRGENLDQIPWNITEFSENGRKALRVEYTVSAEEAAAELSQYEGVDAEDLEDLVLARLILSFPGGVKSVRGAEPGSYAVSGNSATLTVSGGEDDWTVAVEGWIEGDPEKGSLPFTDVSPADYYYEAVEWAYNADPQVTDGTSPTTFTPGKTCSRAEVVTFLWRAAGKPQPQNTDNPFADVAETDWFYEPVLWAVEKGITEGTSPTAFSPKNPCRYDHILTFIYRAVGAGEDGWYMEAYNWAVSCGLIEGTYSGEFELTAGCPRANVVEYLFRYVSALKSYN